VNTPGGTTALFIDWIRRFVSHNKNQRYVICIGRRVDNFQAFGQRVGSGGVYPPGENIFKKWTLKNVILMHFRHFFSGSTMVFISVFTCFVRETGRSMTDIHVFMFGFVLRRPMCVIEKRMCFSMHVKSFRFCLMVAYYRTIFLGFKPVPDSLWYVTWNGTYVKWQKKIVTTSGFEPSTLRYPSAVHYPWVWSTT